MFQHVFEHFAALAETLGLTPARGPLAGSAVAVAAPQAKTGLFASTDGLRW